jgi:hypothetical protein
MHTELHPKLPARAGKCHGGDGRKFKMNEKFYTPVESAEQAREILAELEERSNAVWRGEKEIAQLKYTTTSMKFLMLDDTARLQYWAGSGTPERCNYTKLTPREFIEKVCELMPKKVGGFKIGQWYKTSDGFNVEFITPKSKDGMYNVFREGEPGFSPYYTDEQGNTAYGERIIGEIDKPPAPEYNPDEVKFPKPFDSEAMHANRTWTRRKLIAEIERLMNETSSLGLMCSEKDDTIQQLRRREVDLEKELEGQTHDKQMAEQNYRDAADKFSSIENHLRGELQKGIEREVMESDRADEHVRENKKLEIIIEELRRYNRELLQHFAKGGE